MNINWYEQDTWRRNLEREARNFVDIGKIMIREYPKRASQPSHKGKANIQIARKEIKVNIFIFSTFPHQHMKVLLK